MSLMPCRRCFTPWDAAGDIICAPCRADHARQVAEAAGLRVAKAVYDSAAASARAACEARIAELEGQIATLRLDFANACDVGRRADARCDRIEKERDEAQKNFAALLAGNSVPRAWYDDLRVQRDAAATSERAAIVAWLRSGEAGGVIDLIRANDVADAIASGAHLASASPLCVRCKHPATVHAVDDEERRDCSFCTCAQYECAHLAEVKP